MIMNKMIVNLNMFGMFMKDVIMGNLNITLIVIVDYSGNGVVNSKIF